MSHIDLSASRLTDWQRDAVDRVARPDAAQHDVLITSPGTGKATIAALAARLYSDTARSPVLIAAGRAILAETIALRVGLPPPQTLEMRRALMYGRREPRPLHLHGPLVAHGSLSALLRQPLADVVIGAEWGMLVVDATEDRDAALDLTKALTSRLPGLRTMVLLSERGTEAQWAWLSPEVHYAPERHEVGEPSAVIEVVSYDRSEDERRVQSEVAELIRQGREAGVGGALMGLLGASTSSPVALQSSAFAAIKRLRQARHRLAQDVPLGELEDDLQPANAVINPRLSQVESLIDRLGRLVAEVDDLRADSKLDALKSLIASPQRPPGPALVFCSSEETADYVADQLGFAGIDSRSLVRRSESFGEQDIASNRVIVCADEILEGVDFVDVMLGINYDLTTVRRRLYQRLTKLEGLRANASAMLVSLVDRAESERARLTVAELRYLAGERD
jgi:superfamily II DNA or RNA helicase